MSLTQPGRSPFCARQDLIHHVPECQHFLYLTNPWLLSNVCTGETKKICATSQQGPYCQVRSSGVPPETSPALQTGQERPSFQLCILAAGEHCGSLGGYWGFCRWQGSGYKAELVLGSAECLWAQLEVLPPQEVQLTSKAGLETPGALRQFCQWIQLVNKSSCLYTEHSATSSSFLVLPAQFTAVILRITPVSILYAHSKSTALIILQINLPTP